MDRFKRFIRTLVLSATVLGLTGVDADPFRQWIPESEAIDWSPLKRPDFGRRPSDWEPIPRFEPAPVPGPRREEPPRQPRVKSKEFEALEKEQQRARQELQSAISRVDAQDPVKMPGAWVSQKGGANFFTVGKELPREVLLKKPTASFTGTDLDSIRLHKARAILREAVGAKDGEDARFLGEQAERMMLGYETRVDAGTQGRPLPPSQKQEVEKLLGEVTAAEEKMAESRQRRATLREELKLLVAEQEKMFHSASDPEVAEGARKELEQQLEKVTARVEEKTQEYALQFDFEQKQAEKIEETKKQVTIIMVDN